MYLIFLYLGRQSSWEVEMAPKRFMPTWAWTVPAGNWRSNGNWCRHAGASSDLTCAFPEEPESNALPTKKAETRLKGARRRVRRACCCTLQEIRWSCAASITFFRLCIGVREGEWRGALLYISFPVQLKRAILLVSRNRIILRPKMLVSFIVLATEPGESGSL